MRASPDLTDLRCDRTGELLLVRDGKIHINTHGHTVASDGQFTLQKLSSFAQKHGVNIAVTDHNVAPEPRGNVMPPGTIAGMEVTTAEGVDVVVEGTLEKIQGLFENDVRPALRWWNPRARPTTLSIHGLLDATEARDLFCSFPHYATVEGLSVLPKTEQEKVLERARRFAFMEVNALLTRTENRRAILVGHEWRMPTLRAGDTHRGEKQHVGTYSSLPLDALPDGDDPLILRVLKGMHGQGEQLSGTLRETTTQEMLGTVLQVICKNGLAPIGLYLQKTVLRFAGFFPSAGRDNFPMRINRWGTDVPQESVSDYVL